MKIGNELTREGKIYYCFISGITYGNYFEIARYDKSGITCDCSLLDESLSLIIMAQSSILAAIISCCREIQKVDI